MMELLDIHKVKSYLVEKYVDDVETVCENLDLGTRWTGSALVTSPEAEAEDKEADRARDELTMDIWGQMASSILPSLNFTVDFCSRNKEGTVPMLDFQLWKVSEVDPENPEKMRESLKYSFYEKPMSNPEVMNKLSMQN